jgi:hypothetical protein
LYDAAIVCCLFEIVGFSFLCAKVILCFLKVYKLDKWGFAAEEDLEIRRLEFALKFATDGNTSFNLLLDSLFRRVFAAST